MDEEEEAQPGPRSKVWLLPAALAGAPALVFLTMAIVGAFLPADHVASSSAVCLQGPRATWTVLTNFAKQPSWRPEVEQVERLPDRDGREVWRERYDGGEQLDFETLEAVPPRRLVRRIADQGGPFSGRWEITLEPAPEGCTVTITEHGTVKNPIFRFVARYFIGHTTTIDLYLSRLRARMAKK